MTDIRFSTKFEIAPLFTIDYHEQLLKCNEQTELHYIKGPYDIENKNQFNT